MTEYSGFMYATFFMAEYLGMFAVSGLAVTLFLGGWHAPLRQLEVIPSYIWFFAKLSVLLFVFIWIRGTLPRIRVDQVPIGVDAGRFPSGAREEGPPWRLLRVASLNRVKDYPTLLQAMRHVVDRQPAVHLDIVGHDTLGGTMQALCCRLALEHHVTFHGLNRFARLGTRVATCNSTRNHHMLCLGAGASLYVVGIGLDAARPSREAPVSQTRLSARRRRGSPGRRQYRRWGWR